jgi:hypothetical protein
VHFRVELVWQNEMQEDAPPIYLTSDGRVLLQGRAVSENERTHFRIPAGSDLIGVGSLLLARAAG